MKKLLFIGHSFHNITKSSQFIQDMLESKYEITKFDFDPYKDAMGKLEELNGQSYDIVILWQIMPQISFLKEYIKFDKIAFFPMYDGCPNLSNPIWSEYRECNIINFSKILHHKCKKYGLSSYYIQYFPHPKKVLTQGDEKAVFLWQRIEKINPKIVEKTLGIENVRYLYHHQVSDPKQKLILPSSKWENKVKVSTWFDTREEMDKYMQKCAIYYAPRKLEGIGMSFLEAMAVGRCVIAPNYPTMNEYITNGVNGYLYNLKHPKKIKIKNIRQIQKNTHKYIEKGYKKWNQNKYKILDWIEKDVKANSNEKIMNKKLLVKEEKRIGITLIKIRLTAKYKQYCIFGIPIINIKRNV